MSMINSSININNKLPIY